MLGRILTVLPHPLHPHHRSNSRPKSANLALFINALYPPKLINILGISSILFQEPFGASGASTSKDQNTLELLKPWPTSRWNEALLNCSFLPADAESEFPCNKTLIDCSTAESKKVK